MTTTVLRSVRFLYNTSKYSGFSPFSITFYGQDRVKIVATLQHVWPTIFVIFVMLGAGIASMIYEEVGSTLQIKFVLVAKVFIIRSNIIFLIITTIMVYAQRLQLEALINKIRTFDKLVGFLKRHEILYEYVAIPD